MNLRCAQLALAAGFWLVGASGCTGPEPSADPGMETGPCVEGDCFDGLMCLSSLCVSDDAAAGSDGADGSNDGGADDGPANDGGNGNDGDNDNDGDDGDDGNDGNDGNDDAADGAGDDSADDADDGANDADDGANDAADDAADDGATEDGPCCVAQQTPGCSDPAIEACVCQADTFCCDNAWDGMCVAASAQCGQDCPTAETGPCCTVSPTAGCGDATVEACVCETLPDCCSNEWHLLCPLAAIQCGATC